MAVDVFDKDRNPGISRINSYLADPRELKPDPVLNGRVELPEIENFKRDFLDPRIGQIQPITIKKVAGEPIIVDGVSRWRAALAITEEGLGPHEGGVFKLLCRYYVAKSPVEYFIATIKANIRNDPKPEDDAHNVSLLLHNFQMSEEDIADRVYGRRTIDGKPDVQWVRDRVALTNLTPEALEALKSGKLKPKAAIALAKMSAKAQGEKLTIIREGKTLTVAAIKRVDNGSEAPAAATSKPEASRARKWDKEAFKALVQEYIDSDIPKRIQAMPCENAVRDILGEILDRLDE